jgi:hypothetical protein
MRRLFQKANQQKSRYKSQISWVVAFQRGRAAQFLADNRKACKFCAQRNFRAGGFSAPDEFPFRNCACA